MNSEVPKQFLPLDGKPVLMHTLERFHDFDATADLILVLPKDQIDTWQNLCTKHNFTLKHQITEGGSERFYSVRNGLKLTLRENALIAIHDGVRPFVSNTTLQNCFADAEKFGNAIPCVEIPDSLRKIADEKGKNSMVNRQEFRAIQTPQVFRAEVIHQAFEQEFSPAFTDDASVAEAAKNKIHLVAGNRENIKITTPFDLMIGEQILKELKNGKLSD